MAVATPLCFPAWSGAMADRDVERDCSPTEFVSTLRRVADALERGESVRIQVAGKRFTVPASASLSIEHEAEGGQEELELQLRWRTEG
jgi:amphi-Trp domain-containing protein